MAPGQQVKRTRSGSNDSTDSTEDMKEAMDKLVTAKMEELKTDLSSLFTVTMQKMGTRVCQIDREQRSKNLIIKGVKSKENEKPADLEKAVEGVFAKLGLKKVEIDDVIRLGKRDKADRPILVKLLRLKDMRAIMTEKKKLGKEKIYIERDLPAEDREAAFELRKKFKELKAKDGSLTSSIRNKTLTVWKGNTRVETLIYKEKEKTVVSA